ncbi:MAG: NUDIX hydrolase [Ferruginibacter sp.]
MFQTLSSEYINRHRYFTARKDRYQTDTGKIVDPYFVVELPTAAGAVAITENNEVILIRQYRYPVNEMMIEIPGGFIDPGEKPEEAIRRELLEETGYSFSEIHLLGTTALNPGVLNNFTYMFVALGGVKIAQQSLDQNEEIEIILKPLEEVRSMLMRHEIKQSMHALCIFYAFEFLKANKLA